MVETTPNVLLELCYKLRVSLILVISSFSVVADSLRNKKYMKKVYVSFDRFFKNTLDIYIQQHSASSYLYRRQAIMEFFKSHSGKGWHPPLYPRENNLKNLMCSWVSIVFLTRTQEKFYWKVTRESFNNVKRNKQQTNKSNPEMYTLRKKHNLSIAILFRANQNTVSGLKGKMLRGEQGSKSQFWSQPGQG